MTTPFMDCTILVSNAISNNRTTIAPLGSFAECLENFVVLVGAIIAEARLLEQGLFC